MSLLRRIEKDDQEGHKRPAWTDKQGFEALKNRVEPKVLSGFEPVTGKAPAELRSQLEERFSAVLAEENLELTRREKTRLFDSLLVNIIGIGPLEALLSDETISEIVVVGPKV